LGFAKQEHQIDFHAHRGTIWSSQFSQNGKLQAHGRGTNGLIKLWKPSQPEPVRTFTHPTAVRGLVSGTTARRCGQAIGAEICGAVGRLRRTLGLNQQPGVVYAVAISRDDETLATPAG